LITEAAARKTAIVTGASRGIGAAIAADLATSGYAVVINYKSGKADAEALCAAINAKGGQAAPYRADIAEEAQAAALIDHAITTFGTLNLLVNNAGIALGLPLAEIDAAHIADLTAVNIAGLLFASKHAARVFPATGGVIVNISSVNATSPVPGGAVYSATKAAVNAITVALARELGPRHIRVNAVAPGLTMTERYETLVTDDQKAHVIAETPLRRLGQPRDLCGLVGFLASDEAAWITGQVIAASGGAV
jgi:3-oxoacyl-[acyl-carrier protein] reductase